MLVGVGGHMMLASLGARAHELMFLRCRGSNDVGRGVATGQWGVESC